MDTAFKTVYASFFPENIASKRVMEKCGMHFDHLNEKELTYLDDLYQKGQSNILCMYGHRGIGKTSLILNFLKNNTYFKIIL